jgi:hypothetical protein
MSPSGRFGSPEQNRRAMRPPIYVVHRAVPLYDWVCPGCAAVGAALSRQELDTSHSTVTLTPTGNPAEIEKT